MNENQVNRICQEIQSIDKYKAVLGYLWTGKGWVSYGKERCRAESLREALRVFFTPVALLCLLACLAGCATSVEVDYTPGATCERWCSDSCQAAHPELCETRCLTDLAKTCGAEQAALRNCFVDTHEIAGFCGGENCRCSDEITAYEECEKGAI